MRPIGLCSLLSAFVFSLLRLFDGPQFSYVQSASTHHTSNNPASRALACCAPIHSRYRRVGPTPLHRPSPQPGELRLLGVLRAASPPGPSSGCVRPTFVLGCALRVSHSHQPSFPHVLGLPLRYRRASHGVRVPSAVAWQPGQLHGHFLRLTLSPHRSLQGDPVTCIGLVFSLRSSSTTSPFSLRGVGLRFRDTVVRGWQQPPWQSEGHSQPTQV